MIASDLYNSPYDLFQTKGLSGEDLYQLLLTELNKIGPYREEKKMFSVSLINQRAFASVLTRDNSIKLVIRADHKIRNPRILNAVRVVDKVYDHTIILESQHDIDVELMDWLEQAYQSSDQ